MMNENLASRLWFMRGLYACLAMAIIYGRLMPLDNPAGAWAAPDLLICMTFAWALRRPEFVPPLNVAAVMLLADLMLLRPPGLLAMLVLLGGNILQRRQRDIREMGFPLEWLTVCGALITILVAQRLILVVFLVPQVPLGQSVIQIFITALFYPVVVLVSETVLGVRRATPGELVGAGMRT